MNCGNRLVAGERFCQNCGSPVQQPLSKEEQNKLLYEQAQRLFEGKQFAQAMSAFTRLGDYGDAAARAKQCAEEIETAKKEQLYVSALACLTAENVSDTGLKNAIAALHAIEDYKDAKEKMAELEKRLDAWNERKKAAEDAERKKHYDAALACLAAKNFDEARHIFTYLGDYADSKEQLEKTKQAQEQYQNGLLYEKAVRFLNDAAPNEAMLKNAIGIFEHLGDYQEAPKNLAEAKKRLKKWYDDKKAAEEAEKARIEARRAKRKRIIKIAAIATACVALLTGILLFLFLPNKINYDMAGGIFADEAPQSYRFVSGEAIVPTPVKEGYTFLGWTGTGLDNASTALTIKGGRVGKRSYVANWKANAYNVTFDANGGGVKTANVSMTYDKDVELPIPVRSGYTFAGWYYNDTLCTNGAWKIAEDATLVAKWNANNYTVTYQNVVEVFPTVKVTFNYNYSGSGASEVSLKDGETLSVPQAPARSGYVFVGWYTDATCNNKYTFSGTLTQDITLYAKWQACTVSNTSSSPWSVSGNSLTSTNKTNSSTSTYSITVPVAAKVSFEYKTSSEENYDFLRIKKNGATQNSYSGRMSDYKSYTITLQAGDSLALCYEKDGSGKSGDDCVYITNLSIQSTVSQTSSATAACGEEICYVYSDGSVITQTVTYGKDFVFPTVTREGYALGGWYHGEDEVEQGAWSYAFNTTLTAIWVPNAYTVYLNSNGGTVSSGQLAVSYGTSYSLPTPRKTGYTFDGWYNGTTKYTGGVWNELSNVTLTAKWTAKEYTVTLSDTAIVPDEVKVTFNYNYSGSTPYVVTLKNNEALSYPPVPTRSGYAFAGWYTNSSCTISYGFTGTISADVTYYAKWVQMQSSSYGVEYFDIANHTSSGQQKYVTASSYLGYNYYYFTCYKAGTYTLYATWVEGDFIFNVTNETQGTTLISNVNLYSGGTTSTSKTFTANAGDVICVRTQRYSSTYNYTSNGKFYVSGASYPTSTATASCSTVVGYEYNTDATVTKKVTYGEAYTLPTLTRTGYTFLGWYNGSTPVSTSGTWTYTQNNITLTPQWD